MEEDREIRGRKVKKIKTKSKQFTNIGSENFAVKAANACQSLHVKGSSQLNHVIQQFKILCISLIDQTLLPVERTESDGGSMSQNMLQPPLESPTGVGVQAFYKTPCPTMKDEILLEEE